MPKKHYYEFYLSFGVTVESDENLDPENPEDFRKLRDLTIKHLENDGGVSYLVGRSDFGDIEHHEE
jgi:hypothetical protein